MRSIYTIEILMRKQLFLMLGNDLIYVPALGSLSFMCKQKMSLDSLEMASRGHFSLMTTTEN